MSLAMAPACAECSHRIGDHVLVLVEADPVPGGIVRCPEPACGCWATWSAGPTPSTPDERTALRHRVLVRLALHGWLDAEGVPRLP